MESILRELNEVNRALSQLSQNSDDTKEIEQQKQKLKQKLHQLLTHQITDKLPTSINEVFDCQIKFEFFNQELVEKIKPWLMNKMKNLFGEITKIEQNLVEFICSKLLEEQSSAKILLDNLSIILDEDDAQQLVVQLWRLIIFEIEVKPLKLDGGKVQFDPAKQHNCLVFKD